MMLRLFIQCLVLFLSVVPLSANPSSTHWGPCQTQMNSQNGVCYWAGSRPMSWDNAQKECQQTGGNLITFESEAVADEAKAVTLANGIRVEDPFWIGLRGGLPVGMWRWTTGQLLTGWSNWNGNHPTGGKDSMKMCTFISSAVDFRWEDNLCDAHFHFLCQSGGIGCTVDASIPGCPADTWTPFPQTQLLLTTGDVISVEELAGSLSECKTRCLYETHFYCGAVTFNQDTQMCFMAENSQLTFQKLSNDQISSAVRLLAPVTELPRKCFKMVDSLMGSYPDMSNVCASINGRLAVIDSKAAMERLEYHILSNTLSQENAWIGLTDSETEGEFRWEDGTLLSWEIWDGDEPAGGRNRNYVYMNFKNKEWKTGASTRKFPAVCEIIRDNCTCEEKPPQLGNADIVWVGVMATYRCHEGYRLEGPPLNAVVECPCDCNWDPARQKTASIKCQAITCPASPTIQNSVATDFNSTYNSTVTLRCVKGTQLSNYEYDVTRVCNFTGTWSAINVECQTPCHGSPLIPGSDMVGPLRALPGGVTSMRCSAGHRLTPDNRYSILTRNCTSALTWSDATASCERVSCGAVRVVQNTIPSIPACSVYECEAVYACARGYQFPNTSHTSHVSRCQADGQWSELTTACEPVTCDATPKIQHSIPLDHNNTYNSTVLLRCEDEYQLTSHEENVTRICDQNGRWSPVNVECKRKCQGSPQVANSEIVGPLLALPGDVTSLKCSRGFATPSGNAVIFATCRDDFQWVKSDSCRAISCGEPRSFDNHTIPVASLCWSYGCPVKYTCTEGHVFTNRALVHVTLCQEDGRWSNLSSLCELVSCWYPNAPNPFTVPDLVTGGSGSPILCYTYGCEVVYTCADGFRFPNVEKQLIRCLGDRKWSNLTDISIRCDDSPLIPHSTATNISVTFGSSVALTCVDGYRLSKQDHNVTRVCDVTGNWSNVTVECKPVSCGPPIQYNNCTLFRYVPQNPWLNTTVSPDGCTTYGCSVDYFCAPGFSFPDRSEHHISRCLASGKWSDLRSVCEGTNYTNEATTSVTTTLSVTTAEMTSLLPDPTTNQILESTTKIQPTVVPECPGPPNVEYAEVVVTTRFPGDAAVYTCQHGYRFDTGGVTRVSVCQDSLQWSPVPNECTTENCPALPTRAHMRLSTNSTDVGTMVRAACHVGYRFVDGTDTVYITCISPGKWNRQLGECLYKYCTAVPYVDNAIQIMAHRVRPLLSCNEGHYFSGGVSSKLLSCVNGLWSTGSSQRHENCESTRCPLPTTPRNGTVTLTTEDTLYGAIATAACREGLWFSDYRRPSLTLRCSENGTWNATDLACTGVTCTFESRTLRYNEVVSYSCPSGLRMRDGYERKSLLCGPEGELNDTISDCLANRCRPIPIVQNAMPNTTLATDGSTVVYLCIPGFSFIAGILEKSITCQNQSWDHVSDCKPVVCPRNPPLQFATFGVTDGQYQSSLTVTCDLGYTVDGDKSTTVLTCGNNNQWEPNVTQCEIRKCLDPPGVENATQQGSTVSYLGRVNYTCLPGYTLPGNQREQAAICQHDGTWSHVVKGCRVVTCLPVAVWAGMEVNTTDTARGTILNVSCQNGELLVNRRPWLRTTCSESGEWDPPIPECTKPPEEKKYEPKPEEAAGAQHYGTVAGAILGVVLVCMIIADVPTFYFSRHIVQRNVKDFMKNLKELTNWQKEEATVKVIPLKSCSVTQPPYKP